MNGYMISLIGMVVIAVYSFVILLAAFLISRPLKRFRWTWWLLAPIVLVLLSLPWAEEAWISWHFAEACKDAGVKVYRQVKVDGYGICRNDLQKNDVHVGPLFKQNPNQLADFEKHGFRFYEDILADGGARHLEREGGQVIVTLREKPEARYYERYAYEPNPYQIEEPIGWKLQKIERRVIDSQTGEILGRDIKIIRVLPTHEALIAGLFGPPIIICPGPNVKPFFPPPQFPQAVLKPISKSKE